MGKSKDSEKQKKETGTNLQSSEKSSFFLSQGKRELPPREGTERGSQQIAGKSEPKDKTKKVNVAMQKKRRVVKKRGTKKETAKIVDSKVKKARKRTAAAKRKSQKVEEVENDDFHEPTLKEKPLLVIYRDSKICYKKRKSTELT
eukprot:TRINITY_DN9317_c0_g1_i1.p1 TRINITY_DN9317_c0_g1~~TRINITY_DN9317_c0_g1_i1.p1  ORF type:complete len:145 (+),score=40.16 TRINITY_DN9317_c0_g1_i1:57-491(+)